MKISINITNQITDIKDFGLWKPDAMKMICYKALRRICSRDILCYQNSISKIYKLTLYKQISLVYNNVNTGFPKMAFCEKISLVKRTFILIHLVQKKSIYFFSIYSDIAFFVILNGNSEKLYILSFQLLGNNLIYNLRQFVCSILYFYFYIVLNYWCSVSEFWCLSPVSRPQDNIFCLTTLPHLTSAILY